MIKLDRCAYIFDFDGTMIHSLPLWRDLDRSYLEKHAIAVPDDLARAIEGLSFWDTAHYFRQRFELIDSAETIVQEWLDMIHGQILAQPLKPDVLRFIENSRRQMAIATSNHRFIIEDVLAAHGLSERFQSIATSDEVERSKPDPAVFLKVAHELGRQPADCAVFEDTTAGVIGAKNAGMLAIAVYDPSNAYWEDTAAQADYAIMSFDEIVEV